ncbi:WD repeat-containing protein 13-like [Camellia sinensis]|uniref:WD repeat-containing protein 13-like n=1 Tax=Camellia sinensis TaxID=4442 RepID=UPI00103635CE|nr:WD repeat-containing protein 13-like [Camellia sinensis]
MAEQAIEKSSSEAETKKKKEDLTDPEFFSCVLQPSPADSDADYIGTRRLLLHRKAQSGVLRRKDWRCNGKGYVAFRNYISRPRNWESLHIPSHPSSPGQSGRWISSPGPLSLSFEMDSWSPIRDLRSGSQALSHSPSFSSKASNASDSDHPRRKAEPGYSFVGMHCIFDQCKAMVTVVKFGQMSSDLLAYGASDGTLTVCTVSDPPAVLNQLIGHSKDVTDFDFTSNNQYIASSSMDKTVRIWEISKGLCIRVIYAVSPQLCIRFHPVSKHYTGRVINKTVFDNEVTAMDHDHTGQLIFCGDAQGCVYTVSVNSHTVPVSSQSEWKQAEISCHNCALATLSLCLSGLSCEALMRKLHFGFCGVSLEILGYLTLRCSLKLAPRVHSIRASFCPLLSLEKGEFIVVGSEDANIYFYYLTRPRHACVNKLQGHGYPIIGIAWNHGENLLASSDFGGTVIIWKRAKTG